MAETRTEWLGNFGPDLVAARSDRRADRRVQCRGAKRGDCRIEDASDQTTPAGMHRGDRRARALSTQGDRHAVGAEDKDRLHRPVSPDAITFWMIPRRLDSGGVRARDDVPMDLAAHRRARWVDAQTPEQAPAVLEHRFGPIVSPETEVE